MAGHSKWANIKHRKGAQDKKRSKMFTRLLKEIQVAAKEGGGDADANPRLRLAVQTAKKANVPKDNIEKAVNRGTGGDGDTLEEVTFEGYASNGVAVFVECLTDNNNRTVANVRSYFNKLGGSLGVNGSVAFMFERKAVFTINADDRNEEELLLELIDAGVEEVDKVDELMVITGSIEDYGNISSKLEEMGIEPESSELQRIPTTTVDLNLEQSQSVMKLIDKLEDDDDVQYVFHNLELSDELMAELSSQ